MCKRLQTVYSQNKQTRLKPLSQTIFEYDNLFDIIITAAKTPLWLLEKKKVEKEKRKIFTRTPAHTFYPQLVPHSHFLENTPSRHKSLRAT
jgi:hypothetical protein